MGLTKEQLITVEELVTALEFDKEQQKLLKQELDERAAADITQIATQESIIENAKLDIERIRERIAAEHGALIEDTVKATRSIAQREESLKKYIHNLPQDAIESGFTQTCSHTRLKVSKAKFSIQYRTEALMNAMPELEEMYVDGDPVVVRAIATEVLERLIVDGTVAREDVEPFRVVVKERSPAVTIEEIT